MARLRPQDLRPLPVSAGFAVHNGKQPFAPVAQRHNRPAAGLVRVPGCLVPRFRKLPEGGIARLVALGPNLPSAYHGKFRRPRALGIQDTYPVAPIRQRFNQVIGGVRVGAPRRPPLAGPSQGRPSPRRRRFRRLRFVRIHASNIDDSRPFPYAYAPFLTLCGIIPRPFRATGRRGLATCGRRFEPSRQACRRPVRTSARKPRRDGALRPRKPRVPCNPNRFKGGGLAGPVPPDIGCKGGRGAETAPPGVRATRRPPPRNAPPLRTLFRRARAEAKPGILGRVKPRAVGATP